LANAVSNSTLLGAAAEHYVMYQLLRRDMIAALAPVVVPDSDIIVSNRLGSALAAIQVKARRDIGSDGGWHMNAKHERIVRELLFYRLVDFGRDLSDAPRCWVLPSSIVAEVLTRSYQSWLAKLGKKGQPHKEHDLRRLLPDYSRVGLNIGYDSGWLDRYQDARDTISRKSPSG